jgi:MoaA/NifB/PqqE/SkfB family radical SAM enzyme
MTSLAAPAPVDLIFPPHEENQKIAQRLHLGRLDEALHFPRFFEIETVNACNARCTMCTINDWEKGQNVIMSEALYAKFVHEVAGYADWVETVCLNRDGEPTLDKQLPKRVKMLKEAGIRRVTFATNGQLLLPPLVHQLLDAGLDDIMVSIDGVTKETFEAIRLRLTYETVLQNTLNLIRIRNERNAALTVRVRMVLMERNRHELNDWLAFWKSHVGPQDRIYAKPMHTWGNQLGQESAEVVAQYAEKPCISPFSTVIIEVDGKVPLCGVDYNVKHPMGDFSRQTIKDIWNSPAFTEVRLRHATKRRNEIAMCRGCHIWDEELMVTEAPGPQGIA